LKNMLLLSPVNLKILKGGGGVVELVLFEVFNGALINLDRQQATSSFSFEELQLQFSFWFFYFYFYSYDLSSTLEV